MSSKNLDKYEYLTGEDLSLKPSTVEKAKFEYSPLGLALSKSFKQNEIKSFTKNKSDFNYDANHAFFRLYKGYDEFKEMSLVSKYNRIKEFNKLFINFKNVKTKKSGTQPKKERIMKNVDELYKNYYKNNGLKVNVDGEKITLDKAESLLKDINSKKR